MDYELFKYYTVLIREGLFSQNDDFIDAHAEGLNYWIQDDPSIGQYFPEYTLGNFIRYTAKKKIEKIFDEVEDKLHAIADKEDQKQFYDAIVKQIDYFIYQLNNSMASDKGYKLLWEDLVQLRNDLAVRFNFESNPVLVSSLNSPKIRWLAKTNVLATLIYELWNGQEKPKNVRTKKLIEAQKKDLVQFIINNFLDADGNPLKESTIDTYLNSAREESRAKIGDRIEFETP